MTTDPGTPHVEHPHGPAHADPVLDEVETRTDPAVAEAVHLVRDRFGAAGLRDLITLARFELDVAEQAMSELREAVVDGEPSGPTTAGDAGAR